MIIQINTDNQISGSEEFSARLREEIESSLGRFDYLLTRVEVHLAFEGGGVDSLENNKRCLLEVRPAGQQPISVSHDASTFDLASSGAIQKMEELLEASVNKQRDLERREHDGRALVFPEELHDSHFNS